MFAQVSEYIYDHFDISNGLILDNVYKVLEDKEGHAWIVTYNGLQRFNGYDFETHTYQHGRAGTLSSNYVEDLYEDHKGDLIVVLENGIDVFNKETNQFVNLLSNMKFAPTRRDEFSRIASSAQDRFGSIWVNCGNRLVRIDSLKQEAVVYSDEYLGKFVLDGTKSHLWMITDQSLKKYDIEKRVLAVTNVRDIETPAEIDRFRAIFFDSFGTCWLGTTQGLFVYDKATEQLKNPREVLPEIPLIQAKSLEGNVTAVYEDYLRNLWVASGNKLLRIDRGSHTVDLLKHEMENPGTILDEPITGIHGNQNGTIWVTYLNGGITRINLKNKNFRAYRYRTNGLNSLGGKSVRSVFKDKNGIIWAGLYNDGLDRINPNTGIIDHFRYEKNKPGSICSNYISALYVDSKQRLWVGSHNDGLCIVKNLNGGSLYFERADFLNGNEEVYHIREDSLGRIWIGTREGLYMFSYLENECHKVLRNCNVQSFLFDGTTIWIASWDHGIGKLVFNPDQFGEKYPEYDPQLSLVGSISGDKVDGQVYEASNSLRNGVSIFQDTQGKVWLGTFGRGLVEVNMENDQLTYRYYTVSEGAPGNAIYGIAGDREGNIWISTEHGIGKLDPSRRVFENYYREDGLLSDFFMWKSYFMAEDGEIFFGSVDGLNLFYPEEITRDTVAPPLCFSELRIHNRKVEVSDTVHGEVILSRHIQYQDTLVFSHLNQNLSIHFYSPAGIHSRELKYSHMLEGFDKGWILNEKGNRSAAYNSLRPGTYALRVRATFSGNRWPEEYAEKTLIILPPWWKTQWAVMIYFLIVAGLFFLISHLLVRFVSLRQELHYTEKLHESKLRFFTNISHEFKTPLSLIKAPITDILKEKDLSPHSRKNLHIVQQNADNLLHLVHELMEFRKTETGVSKLLTEPIEIAGFVGEIFTQFECIAQQKGIQLYSSIPEEEMTVWVDKKKFGIIVNNLIENALRHTMPEGLVSLSIIKNPKTYRFKPQFHSLQVNRADDYLDFLGLLVTDTGVGISRESLPRIFDRFFQIDPGQADKHVGSGIGLALVKNLVLLHHGEIWVASERKMGTEILVLIPLGDRHLKKEEKLVIPYHKSEEVLPKVKMESSASVEDPVHAEVKLPGNSTILLVDDHDEFRAYLIEHLSGEYHIKEASNGEEAEHILKNEKPELIIADWVMPVMGGAALIKSVRENEEIMDIPIILLTAKEDMKDHQEGLELGADLVLTKPFDTDLLRSQIRRTISNQRSRKRKFSMEHYDNIRELRNSNGNHFMKDLEKVIRENIGDSTLNAEMIARKLGMSRTILYEKVKTVSGQTIGELLQRLRLDHAVKLMIYEDKSVSEAGIMAGFNSSSYMIRLFKKHYHTTPGEYIRNYLKASSN